MMIENQPSARTCSPLGVRIGIDLGGTKIAGIRLGNDGAFGEICRVATPRGNYEQTLVAIGDLVAKLAREDAVSATDVTVGLGMPGSINPVHGTVQNANSTWLNGRAFRQDLEAALKRPLRLANDADCFALSEAHDGAAAGVRCVFGVILGTGVGGGLVIDGRLVGGPRGSGGEWGHNPLPWVDDGDLAAPRCWCGQVGCLESWLSGPGLVADHARVCGETLSAEEIVLRAGEGAAAAQQTLDRHAHRLARGLAHVANIVDPDVVVLGGGLSHLRHLYEAVPLLIKPYLFTDAPQLDLRPPKWGDASGVRGAARLWDVAG